MIYQESEVIFDLPQEEDEERRSYLVLIIYDLQDNKRRNKLATLLKGYGFRIQLSAFECPLPQPIFLKLKKELEKFAKPEDKIRIYRLSGRAEVTILGQFAPETEQEEVVIV